MAEIDTINDVLNLRAIPAAVAANNGAVAVQNVAGTLKQVTDQGVATDLSGGGLGTLTATVVGATAGVAAAATAGTDYLPGNDFGKLAAFITARYPTLSVRFVYFGDNLAPGLSGSPVTSPYNPQTTASTLEGGGLKTTQVAQMLLGGPVWNTPKTGAWAFAFRGKMTGGGVTGHDTYFGIINYAITHAVTVGRKFATSSTKWTLSVTGAADATSTVNADSLVHTLLIASDGTTVSLFVDPLLSATAECSALSSGLTNEPMYPEMYESAGGETQIAYGAYGFVAP